MWHQMVHDSATQLFAALVACGCGVCGNSTIGSLAVDVWMVDGTDGNRLRE